MRAIIVEDDLVSREFLKTAIKKVKPNLTIAEEFDNASDALNFLKENAIDLIFLDIEMPGMTGIEFIAKVSGSTQIVVVTSKDDYAAEAYNFDVTDYIVKPVQGERLAKALDRVTAIMESVVQAKTDGGVVFMRSGHGLERVDPEKVLYVEANSDYVNIYLDNKKRVIINSTMKIMEAKLASLGFVRVHRSFIVSIKKIDRIVENVIYIEDESIPVSRNYKEALMNSLKIL